MAKPPALSAPKHTKLEEKLFRLVGMVLFAFILYFVFVGFLLLSALQFIFILAEDHPNAELAGFSARLRSYSAEIYAFLDYSSERHPFPFSSFPKK